ncbi:MAG: carbohydrate-binding domain-containing protein, partial [Eubacteriales bacterium]|nr:carbohydrate-binding domain-containing protein [Eubacteriales bacterium]
MTHFYHKLTAVLVALAMVLVLAACGSKTASDVQSGEGAKTEVTEESTPKSTNTDLFTDRDLDPSYENATTMDLSKESASKVTISKAGTYILTGTYNGQVVVNVGDQDKVQLVLDNVTIANNDSAAIYVQAGDKVFVTLKDGTTNKISSSASFSSADADTGDKIDAANGSKAT